MFDMGMPVMKWDDSAIQAASVVVSLRLLLCCWVRPRACAEEQLLSNFASSHRQPAWA